MTDGFDFSEFEKFAKSWQEATKGLEDFYKRFILEQGLRALAQAKDNTPTITGFMKAMWGVGSQNIVVASSIKTGKVIEISKDIAVIDMVGENFEITIWNNVEYASFVEYGARNKDGSWRQGQFILTIAVDDVNRKMPQRFQKDFKKYLESLGAA